MRKELIWKDWKVDLKARQPHIPVERTLKRGTYAPMLRFSFDALLLDFWYLGPCPDATNFRVAAPATKCSHGFRG